MKIKGLITFCLFSILSFISCVTTVTSKPQPVDVEAENTIPKSLQGIYLDTNTLFSKITIQETYVLFESEKVKVISKKEIDSNGYFVRENKLYEIDLSDGYPMSIGFDFKEYKDSISYLFRKQSKSFINSDFILKRIGSKWLVNLKGEKGWWQPYVLEQSENGDLTLNFLDSDSLVSDTNFSVIHTVKKSLGNINYIDANWRIEDINKMINKGVFGKSIITLKKTKQ